MGNGWNLDGEQQMELKTMITGLGLLLLFILLLGKLTITPPDDKKEDDYVHTSLVEEFHNVWIMEANADGVVIFKDGEKEQYGYGKAVLVNGGEGNSGKENPGDGNFGEVLQIREQLADIVVTDGCVTELEVKDDKINGRILSVEDTFVEVEGYGKLPFEEGYKGYRIYKELTMCSARDLQIGYDFADFVLEEGKICGVLMVREEAMESIRVLIKTGDYGGTLHQQVVLAGDCDLIVDYGSYDNPAQQVVVVGQEISIDANSEFFQGDRIVIKPQVLTGKIYLNNVSRSQGIPAYRGTMELLKTEGGVVLINELPLEEYLYCVVPSEMPSSYPSEALKAQAICARTYAYGHMLRAGYPQYGAHVDDSTSYQVYNNILEQEPTTTAVKETFGQLLYQNNGELAGTYYYSTSCGVGSDAKVWKTNEAQGITYLEAKGINRAQMEKTVAVRANAFAAVETAGNAQSGGVTDTENLLGEQLQSEDAFRAFITGKDSGDFEVTEGWYRWSYQVKKIDVDRICDIVQKRYSANSKLVQTYDGKEFVSQTVEDFKEIRDMYIAVRGAGGVADELHLVTENTTLKIISEHNIRYVLNNGESKIIRQDGSTVASPSLLPSAFFAITVNRDQEKVIGYTLDGGGFGHGVGMSQNGAKHMAEAGYSAGDILLFFYDNCFVKNVYGT